MYPKSINNLIESFKYFPGIGQKTAERLAFSLLTMEKEQIEFMSKSILDVSKNIKRCKVCNNFCEDDTCLICSDTTRNHDSLCVVEDPKAIYSIEKMNIYHGDYHVINGLISSIDAFDPDKIQLNKLIERLNNSKYKEVIIAVKPCIEGEMTAIYIKNVLVNMNIKVSRIASGIPMGADMEYIDALTFQQAFDNRKIIS